jgi:hypothetical protein
MDEAGADQLVDGSLRSILWIAAFRVSVKDKG